MLKSQPPSIAVADYPINCSEFSRDRNKFKDETYVLERSLMADIPPALDREGLPLPGNASTGETAHATSQESVSPCSCQAADELSHEDLKLISQFAPFALILIEADGKFRYLNSKFLRSSATTSPTSPPAGSGSKRPISRPSRGNLRSQRLPGAGMDLPPYSATSASEKRRRRS